MSRSSAFRVSFVSYIFLRACTALHLSAEVGHLEICRLLLQNNADTEAKNIECNALTPAFLFVF
jgi:hypothetical protein